MDTMTSVIISLITSLVVSLFTFILGLKAGKNQTDRARIQDIYKRLYIHFECLREALHENKPMRWEQFDKKSTVTCVKYLPLVRAMKENGEALYIKESILQIIEKLEKELLNFGQQTYNSIGQIHKCLMTQKDKCLDGGMFESYDKGTNNFFMTSSRNSGGFLFRPCDYREFYERASIEKLFAYQESKENLVLEFSCYNDGYKYIFKIYPNSLSINNAEFIDNFYSSIANYVPDFFEYEKTKKQFLKSSQKILKKLKSKAREPHSFIETIVGAFTDIFR